MRSLQRASLSSVPLTEATVESFWDGSRSGTAEQCLRALCLSHERLRAELQGAEILLAEEPGKSAVRSMLTACKEAVAVLRLLNDHERVCRELIAAKVEGGDDMAIVLSNAMRHLDNAAEAVEHSLSPQRKGTDFRQWMRETFVGRDVDLKMEAVPHAHIFNYDQVIELATFIWNCIEKIPTPWWSKHQLEADAKLSTVLDLTDTGSAEFKKAFPPKSAGESLSPHETVPGWRVVEKIRETILDR